MFRVLCETWNSTTPFLLDRGILAVARHLPQPCHPERSRMSEAALNILEEIEDPNAEKVRKKLDIWRNG